MKQSEKSQRSANHERNDRPKKKGKRAHSKAVRRSGNMEIAEEEAKCTCKDMDPDELHPCPLAQEFSYDDKGVDESSMDCGCCSYCTQQCALDI